MRLALETSSLLARYVGRPRSRAVLPEASMTLNLITLQPIIALLAGILILIIPRLLNFIVAIYLIIVGITGLIR